MEVLESLKKLWGEASTLKRGLIVGVPVLVLAAAGAGVGLAMSGGGGEASDQVRAATPTSDAATSTPMPSATVPPLPTDTPASAGLQATDAAPPSGGGGGTGTGNGVTYQERGGTGPGPATDTGITMSIPSIGVNASVFGRTVGTNGKMGNPSGPWDVVWYDFSAEWPGLAGYPGEPGANAVFAGHVDYIRVGPAVFWSLRDLKPGDVVTVNTPNGTINYSVQWSAWATPEEDFTPYVDRTGQEVITLVTCIGGFSGGTYSNRLIIRGVRI